MAIITNTDVKSYLKIDNSAHDTQIDNFILACQKQCEKYCNQPFESQSFDFYFRGLGADTYVLPYKPVTALNSLSYRNSPTDAWTSEASGDIALFEERSAKIIFNASGFAYNVFHKANITSGYTFLNMPADLKQIVVEMVAVMYHESQLTGDGRLAVDTVAKGFAGETETTKFLDLWQTKWKELLKPYRVPTV